MCDGWVCDMSCRLSNTTGTGARWPAHIVDVKLALRFIKEHIADYGGDPDCIVIAGGAIFPSMFRALTLSQAVRAGSCRR